MYRCSICHSVSPPHLPQLRHVVERTVGNPPRREIAAELVVCPRCKAALEREVLTHVIRRFGKPRPDKRDQLPEPPTGPGAPKPRPVLLPVPTQPTIIAPVRPKAAQVSF